jgi:hypothetical protein
MTWKGKANGREGDKKTVGSRVRYDELRAAQGKLALQIAERIHHGEMTYSEGEVKLIQAKAGPQYQNLARAEREAPAMLHTALTRVDEQDTAQQQARQDAEARQASYAAQRQAHSEAWFKTEATRPAPAATKPKGMTPN